MAQSKPIYLSTILISAITMAVGLVILFFVKERVLDNFLDPMWASRIQIGVSLLIFWLVVSSGMRSIASLKRSAGWMPLILSGTAIGLVGLVFAGLMLSFFLDWGNVLSNSTALYSPLFASILVALLSTINIKIKNRTIGNIIELIIIIGAIWLVVQWLN